MGATVGEGRYEQVDDLVRVEQDPVQVGAAVIAGKILWKPEPVYPASAKAAHVAGKVILRAIIGRDGHIRNLSFVQVPSPDLAVAAMQAVRNWTYSPFLINGRPVEVDTTITVTYTFGKV